MDKFIKVDDIVDCSDFFDLSKYKLCFTTDNEPVYVPTGESADRVETAADKELTPYQALKNSFPLWEKTNLTLEEAAVYSGIGMHKLRELTDDDDCEFVVWVGSKRLIKREKFNAYIAKAFSI